LKKINTEINNSFNFAEKSAFPTKADKYNFNNQYSKLIKTFYKNKITFKSKQEDHKPKPY
jgi:methyltransferase-like protein